LYIIIIIHSLLYIIIIIHFLLYIIIIHFLLYIIIITHFLLYIIIIIKCLLYIIIIMHCLLYIIIIIQCLVYIIIIMKCLLYIIIIMHYLLYIILIIHWLLYIIIFKCLLYIIIIHCLLYIIIIIIIIIMNYLDGDVALGDFPHVESNGGNHVFAELTGLEHKQQQTQITHRLWLITYCIDNVRELYWLQRKTTRCLSNTSDHNVFIFKCLFHYCPLKSRRSDDWLSIIVFILLNDFDSIIWNLKLHSESFDRLKLSCDAGMSVSHGRPWTHQR